MTSITSNNSSKHSMRKTTSNTTALPIIDDRLYFMITKYRPKNSETLHFFTIDHLLKYEPFFLDFGPLNLGCLYKFTMSLKHKLKDPKLAKSKIYYYCGKDVQKIANACYLIGAFQVLFLNRNPLSAYNKVKEFAKKAMPFRDASMGICTWKCTVEDCIYSVYRAKQLQFINFSTFNVDEYEHYEKVEYGDLNIIVPNKFIAFAGPFHKEYDDEGYPALTPDFYIPIWKKFNVTCIVRLNKKCYDKRIWTRAGFKHYDLYFIDGTTPSNDILNKFLQIAETTKGVIAVHCKAGLGRTGSCIGCYMMKHYCWTAAESIAWLRVCRPGSVLGPQQHYLQQQQPIMWREGDIYRKKHGIKLKYDPRIEKFDINNNSKKVRSNNNNNNNNSNNNNKNNNNNNNNNRNNNQKQHNLYDYHSSPKNNPFLKNSKDGILPTDGGQRQGETLRQQKHNSPNRNKNDKSGILGLTNFFKTNNNSNSNKKDNI